MHTVSVRSLSVSKQSDQSLEATISPNIFSINCCPRRALWASFGVIRERASCDVLSLGLEPVSKKRLLTSTGDEAGWTAQAAHPPSHSNREDELHRQHVFVCENPVVVAEAADVLGGSAPPIVCTEGIPNTAALLLLEQMSKSDCRLVFHGDFDWGGVRIFNHVRRNLHENITPWRFGRDHYLRDPVRAGD
jgi:uncharacterized protein (TIGR02679 family)